MSNKRQELLQQITQFCFTCFRAMSSRQPAALYPSLKPLALNVLNYQRQAHPIYQRYCQHFAKTSDARRIQDFPPLPTTAFKREDLCPFNKDLCIAEFRSSGTTEASKSRHAFRDLNLMQGAIFQFFSIMATHGLLAKPRYISLMPPYEQNPSSSLGYMLTQIVRILGDKGSGFAFSAHTGLELDFLIDALQDAQNNAVPVHLLGPSLAYAEVLNALGTQTFALPTGSRLMETGGNKGRKTQVGAETLRPALAQRFGLHEEMIYAEYGMCELSSQLYEIRAPSGASPLPEAGLFLAPPWCQVFILNPQTLEVIDNQDVGQIAIFDLCNLDSAAYILTGDLGQWCPLNKDCASSLPQNPARALRLLGRAPQSEPKGCSMAWEDLLQTSSTAF